MVDWLDRWKKGTTGWHRSDINPQLIENINQLAKARSQKIFVPLCGASLDMKYLIDQGWSQFPIIIQGFRYFNVYGDGEAHKKDQRSPVSKFADQAQQTGEIRLFEGSDDFLRDFVCVQDVVAVHTQMLQKPVSGIFNVGTGTARSFASIAESIAQAHQAKVTCIPMPEKLKGQYQTYTCADLTALNSVIAKTEWLSPDDYLQGKHLVMAEAD